MSSIHSFPATGAALRASSGTGRRRPGRAYAIRTFSCMSRAYKVHMMNVRRLSGRFLSRVTFSSAYVTVLVATS